MTLEHPNLHLTSEEKRYFSQLFSAADTDKLGVVTGEVAVKFFEKTRLPSDILGEIWQIADTENRGLLTPSGFGIVLRLIGYAQGGRQISPELALKREETPWKTFCRWRYTDYSLKPEVPFPNSMASHHLLGHRRVLLRCKHKVAVVPSESLH